MTISMYEASVPVFSARLKALSNVLAAAEQNALDRKIDPQVFLTARLAPDMFPLSRQVQIASDTAKIGAARLASIEAPAFEDNEKTLPELIERTRKTVDFLKTLKPEQFEGAEDRMIRWSSPRAGERSMIGLSYALHQVLPNVHFHCTTTYDILRHNGVELGKMDYLGREPPA